MSHSDLYEMRLIVCGLLLIGLMISPVMAYNLSIEKNITNGPYYVGDEVTWIVTVENTGDDPVNVTVYEDIIGLKNVTWISNSTNNGTFNNTTSEWNITELNPGETALLTIVTSFAYPEQQTNIVNVTLVNETAPEALLNASRTIDIGESVTATMEIKPETLNLKSKGAFTVFINVSDVFDEAVIDRENSSITCNDSVLRKLILPDDEDGKLIAKFDRTSLNVTANDSVTISCVGEIVIGGETIRVEGSDTIRVIGEKPADTFIDKILKFLGLRNDDSEEANQALVDAIPETINNLGQAKKYLKENPTVESGSDTLEDLEVIDQEEEAPSVTHGGKPEKEANDSTPPVTECNEGNCKGGKDKGA
ncbi:MAG: DUF11 domain-containing protein [Methanomicrobiales archaeon]|nr:DUF11 domain-containing protein [Methanomicrobiales archaeon]